MKLYDSLPGQQPDPYPETRTAYPATRTSRISKMRSGLQGTPVIATPDGPRILEEQARDWPFLDNHAATEVQVEAQGFQTQVVVMLDAASDPAAILEVRVENGTAAGTGTPYTYCSRAINSEDEIIECPTYAKRF